MSHQLEQYAIYCHPLQHGKELLHRAAFKTGYCLVCGQIHQQWMCPHQNTVPHSVGPPQIPLKSSRLLDLPAEIRRQILQHVFAGAGVRLTAMYAPSQDVIIWRAILQQAGILRSCKLLHSEGTPILMNQLAVSFPLEFTSSYAPSRLFDRIGDRIHHLPRLSRRPSGIITHMLPKAHVQWIHNSVRHIQLPELTLNNLAHISLKQYTRLQSVKFSLIKDGSSGFRLQMLFSTTPDDSQLSENILQQEWSRNPLQCLKLPHPVTEVTAECVRTPDFIGEKESYVGVSSCLRQSFAPLNQLRRLTLHL